MHALMSPLIWLPNGACMSSRGMGSNVLRVNNIYTISQVMEGIDKGKGDMYMRRYDRPNLDLVKQCVV